MFKLIELPNLKVLRVKLPEDLYSKILNECLHCKEKNVKIQSGLSGQGTPVHYQLQHTKEEFFKFLNPMVDEWLKAHPDYARTHYSIQSNDFPYRNGDPWINVQEKGEYLPLHKHDGILSYSIWIKIPDNDQKERYTSFQFSYNSTVGITYIHDFLLKKEDEGTMLLFPSMLHHSVAPFYNDETRISVSGNIH